MSSLPQLRKQIDRIDDQLVKLLNRRMTYAEAIGGLKALDGSRVYDRNRELEVLARICKKQKGPMTDREVRGIYQLILKASRQHQQRFIRKAK